MVIAAAGGALSQNQLGTGGNHQILLVDAQAAAGLVVVSYTHLDVYKRQVSSWAAVSAPPSPAGC